jgi:hypothetical protein
MSSLFQEAELKALGFNRKPQGKARETAVFLQTLAGQEQSGFCPGTHFSFCSCFFFFKCLCFLTALHVQMSWWHRYVLVASAPFSLPSCSWIFQMDSFYMQKKCWQSGIIWREMEVGGGHQRNFPYCPFPIIQEPFHKLGVCLLLFPQIFIPSLPFMMTVIMCMNYYIGLPSGGTELLAPVLNGPRTLLF